MSSLPFSSAWTKRCASLKPRSIPSWIWLIRLWLAQAFWVSGVLKLANWDTALTLATYEYPVPGWIRSRRPCWGNHRSLGSMLLAFGLATRLAAIPLLILTLVIQFEYLALDQHLYWAALFGWYIVMGAGPISLDRLLTSGLAIFGAAVGQAAGRLYAALTRYLGPVYQLGCGCGWRACGLPGAGGAFAAGGGAGFRQPLAGVGAWRPAGGDRRDAGAARRGRHGHGRGPDDQPALSTFPARPDRAARAGTDRRRHRSASGNWPAGFRRWKAGPTPRWPMCRMWL
jgi:uncharacterized membrane protein YphA (DoxX/SURF4 family)